MQKMSVVALVLLAATLCLAQSSQSQPAQQPSAPATQTQNVTMQPAAPAGANPEVMTPDSLKWSSYASGIEMAVLSGDPNASGGLYTIRLKMVDGNQIAPHWHPEDESVTVLSGTLQVGMGDKFDATALKSLPAGSHALVPKDMRHYAKASGATIIEVYGQGPFKINYVNPADDPANAKK